jgi:hypothetical protein
MLADVPREGRAVDIITLGKVIFGTGSDSIQELRHKKIGLRSLTSQTKRQTQSKKKLKKQTEREIAQPQA